MAVEPIALSDLSARLSCAIDLLICCGSFEDRCLSASEAIGGTDVKRVIVAEHVNLHRHVASNTAKLMGLFGNKAARLALDSSSPVASADSIADALTGFADQGAQRVLIDTTTFTHESLLLLLGLVSGTFSARDEVHFVYTVAGDYCPGTPDEKKWLSKGISDIRSILGYPGSMRPGRGTHLVLLHGFEAERSKSLITRYEPQLLSLGRPEDGSCTAYKHVPKNRRVHEEVLRFAKNAVDVEEFSFAANDPAKSARAIAERCSARDDLNVVVAPMNTKISAIGAALAARRNPLIQICYVQPVTYNYDNYSIPSDRCYVFQLPELFTVINEVRPRK